MARIAQCATCGRTRKIRRLSGDCDSCYHRKYRQRPGIKEKMNRVSRVWKTTNKEKVSAYNQAYWEEKKNGNTQRNARRTEDQG